MTLKTQKFREGGIGRFLGEIFRKFLIYFQKIFSQNFKILVKKMLILQDFGKIKKKKKKKNPPKMENMGRLCPKNSDFFNGFMGGIGSMRMSMFR